MSLRKKKIVMYVSMLFMTMCLFFSNPVSVKAKENNNDIQIITTVTLNNDDIPKEIKEPVERGKRLLSYLIMSIGAIFALIGFVMFLYSLAGHPEQRLQSILFFGAGLLTAFSPVIVNWLLGTPLF